MDFNKLWQKKQADADEVEEKVDSTNNKVVHKKSVEQEALNTVCNELFQVLIDLKIINSSAATSAPRPKKQADILKHQEGYCSSVIPINSEKLLFYKLIKLKRPFKNNFYQDRESYKVKFLKKEFDKWENKYKIKIGVNIKITEYL